ncbi:metalloregulator ArsR/SmtB family transcription factor [Agromyces sp. NPDC049794]|uniref:ArsR/SmtB family transcription factor n=1 Tax=unclassified Agromyces TaxID=2639701 RepID=UPI0033E0DFFE
MNYQVPEDDGLDAVFAALANPDRRQMIDLLAMRPASIGQLADHVGMSLPAINRHITVLEESGLVQRRKHGRVNFLALRREQLRRLQEWTNRYQTYWGSDEETLENYIAAIERTGNTAERESDPADPME